MEYTSQPTPIMGHSPFFYYNPDRSSENRPHGHFTPHPHGLPMAILPSTPEHLMPYQQPTYHRPHSADAQMYYHPTPAYISQAMLTPVASPRAHHYKPTILVQQDMPGLMPLNTDCRGPHPATPTLSTAGSFSSVSSPPSSVDMLPTPVNGMFIPKPTLTSFSAVKEGCEEEVFSEVLAGGDWTTRPGSPPMTPVFLHPTSAANNNNINNNDDAAYHPVSYTHLTLPTKRIV